MADPKRVVWLKPVEHESLGGLEEEFTRRGDTLRAVAIHSGELRPELDSFDVLIVGGGGLVPTDGIHYPWLEAVTELVREAVIAGRHVLGICLGAQLLARAFGGTITRNDYAEVGWHSVRLSAAGAEHPLAAGLPPEFVAFHWHHDVAGLPPEAELLASSAACATQAFAIGPRALGVQFHPEITRAKAETFVATFGAPERAMELDPFVQSRDDILDARAHFADQELLLGRLLDNLLAT